MLDRPSWSDDGAVSPPGGAPGVGERFAGVGVLGGCLLVQVDAQAGVVVEPVGAVANLGAAGEDLLCALGEDGAFLDTEVVDGQVEVHVRGVADRRNVAGPVPGGA